MTSIPECCPTLIVEISWRQLVCMNIHDHLATGMPAHAAMGHIGTGGACEILVRAALAA